jgi:excisionase family DNA binding protein
MSKVVPISPRQAGKTAGLDAMARLEKLEDSLISSLQDVRSIKAELRKETDESPTLEKLMGADEVAKHLGESERWVYQQVKAKKMPAIRIGKFVKFSPSALQKWIEQRTKALDS